MHLDNKISLNNKSFLVFYRYAFYLDTTCHLCNKKLLSYYFFDYVFNYYFYIFLHPFLNSIFYKPKLTKYNYFRFAEIIDCLITFFLWG